MSGVRSPLFTWNKVSWHRINRVIKHNFFTKTCLLQRASGRMYEDDFEDDDDERSRNLPPIDDSRPNSRATERTDRKKDGTKLPKIKTQKDVVAEQSAALLFKACKGLVKPEDAVLKVLIKKSHADRMDVKEKFYEQYDLDLATELKGSMGADFAALIDGLLTEREQTDCESVETALDNTDIPTLVKLLCSRNSSAIASIKKSYKKRNGTTIEEDIEKDIDEADCRKFIASLLQGKKQSGKVDEDKADSDAQDLYDDDAGKWSEENGKFMQLMNSCSLPQIKALFESYKVVSGGESIEDAMQKDGCSSDFIAAVKAMVSTMTSGPGDYADQIRKNLSPNNKVLITTLIERGEMDLPSIQKAYQKKYKSDLANDITHKCGKAGPLTAQLVGKGGGGGGGKGQGAKDKEKSGAKVPAKKTEKSKSSATEGNASGKNATAKSETKDQNKKAGSKKEKKETEKASSEDNSDEDATKIHEAMKGWGTDEGPLIDILSSRSNAERQKIKKKYKEKYNEELIDDLKSELTGDFEELIVALMMTPTEYDVYCLHESMDGLGTDESILIGILCSRNAKEINNIKEAYAEKYGTSLEDDVIGDTSGDFKELLVELIKAGRDQGTTVDKTLAENDAKVLFKNGDNIIDVKDEVFRNVLCLRNRPQVRATMDEYKKLSGQTLEDGIRNAMIGDAEAGFLGLAGAIDDPVEFYAKRLNNAMMGRGTNDTQLIRIIVARREIDLPKIKSKYKEIHGKTLEEDIEDECSGDYKKLLLELIK